MRIAVPNDFAHVGDLPAREADRDPRNVAFREQEVVVDLRGVAFVRPGALLWCAVYPLLAMQRGSKCRLLVPENVGVCVYLQDVGLFSILKDAGVEVDDLGVAGSRGGGIVMPLARFSTESEVDDLANGVLDRLKESGLGSANLYPLVSEVFAEMALNAVEHSESSVDSFGFIQFYQSAATGRRFVCSVADGGIGIRRSLERNKELAGRVDYDWTAIKLAVQERVSGTGSPTRGIGLYGIADEMRRRDRQLLTHSGQGVLRIDGNEEVRRERLSPGTLTFTSFPC